MKSLSVILLFILAGCATTTTPELIEQARLTGDWSRVDKRFSKEQSRITEQILSCPKGTTNFCETSNGIESCSCISNSELRQVIDTVSL